MPELIRIETDSKELIPTNQHVLFIHSKIKSTSNVFPIVRTLHFTTHQPANLSDESDVLGRLEPLPQTRKQTRPQFPALLKRL